MALSKRLISALIAFSMSATIATTAFAQTDNSITLNEEQNQLQTVEPSQEGKISICLLYTSPSPRDPKTSRMPSSA